MTDEIVLYTNPMSRGRVARWMLEEVGVPYRAVVLDFEKREHKGPDYLAVNPMGKVPALVHRGTVITETGAILAYLADAFPEAKLAPPPGDPKRGTYYRWMFFGAGVTEPTIIERLFKRPPIERPGAAGWGTYEDAMSALEGAIKPGPYILGDHFTAADVYVASGLGWAMMMKAIEPRPAFVEYVGRCRERPAAKAAEAKDAVPRPG